MGQTLKWWPAQSTDGRPRWREQKNIYNQREISRGRGRQFGRHQEVLLVEYQKKRRRIHPWTRLEDGPWPPPQLRHWRSVPQRSCLTIDEVLTKAQFLSPFLYQIHCIGPVGFGLAYFYSERPPQTGTLQLTPSLGRTCVPVRTIIEQGRAKPPRGNDDGQPTGPQMENCREVPRSAIVWRHVRGPSPHQGPDDPRTS